MSEQISFIHAADLHLDSPFMGLANVPPNIFQEIKESTFRALERLVETAIHKKVDFVLLVGDLFDNEKQSLKAQMRLRKAFEKLQRHQIHVYVSYGNHDHINGNVYPVTYPDNVFIFPSETVTHFIYEKNGQSKAAIHGFSYENRSVTKNKAQQFVITEPLKRIPFQIAMLHGSIESNTEHNMYAPFQIGDLTKEDYHYWALGHIHQRHILKRNPFIAYPGNTQGRHRKELGEKGCYHVVMSQTNTEISFIPLQEIQFENITIDISACNEIHEIETVIQSTLNKQNVGTPQLIDLTLRGDQPQLMKWKNESYLDELIEVINETLIHPRIWKYIFRFTVQINIHKEIPLGDHFIGELALQFEQKTIHSFIDELYKHRQGRKYLEGTLSAKEEQQIKNEAKQLLMNEFLFNRGE